MPVANRKRPAEEFGAIVPAKFSRLPVVRKQSGPLENTGSKRLSNLDSPIMQLSGHGAEVFCCKFHPDGDILASAGCDRQICFPKNVFTVSSKVLWNVYGDCDNYAVLTGHKGAILDLHFNTDGSLLFTASSDHTLAAWDVATGAKIRRLKGHQNIVNSCHPSRRGDQLVCSASDDSGVFIWDLRIKYPVEKFSSGYQVTSVSFSDTAHQIFSGGIDNVVKTWDLRRKTVLYTMHGHTDTITGLALSPDGSYVLTNSMDHSMRIYDVRPYAPVERCVKSFHGLKHNFEKNLLRCSWSPNGLRIAGGSSDSYVYVFDTTTRNIIYKLPGHKGSVNEVFFHPTESVIASCSSDRTLYLGEIV